jgi:adenosylcobinamide kinase / adenosylcobinamide-phosphate guanylyltransferase
VGRLLVVTGGTRSGKSRYTVERAQTWGSHVLYVATCQPADAEMRARVRRHQAERPPTWTTVESTADIPAVVQHYSSRADGILLDCLTLYVASLLMVDVGEDEVAQQVEELCLALRQVPCPSAIVTNEVGWGVVPETPLGRFFRDAAGRANQVAARHAGEVVLMVSGLPLVVKSEGVPSP